MNEKKDAGQWHKKEKIADQFKQIVSVVFVFSGCHAPCGDMHYYIHPLKNSF